MLIRSFYCKDAKTITPSATLHEAIQRMINEDINAFIVMDDEDRVVGILSLQDIAGATVPKEFRENPGMALAMYVKGFFHEICKELKDRPVADIMRKKFLVANLETNVLAVMADFLENDLYVVPVIENRKLLGVVTRSNVKQALALGMGISV